MVIAPLNVARAEDFFPSMGLNVVTGRRYLGGIIGDQIAEAKCLEENVEGWMASLWNLSRMAHSHPETAYTRLQNSFQQE